MDVTLIKREPCKNSVYRGLLVLFIFRLPDMFVGYRGAIF